MDLNNPALTLALAFAAGMICQVLAQHLGIPGIVLLLLAGVALGPDVAGIIRPGALGPALQTIVDFAVAVILFDGAMGLEVRRLLREGVIIRRLITVGALVTGLGVTLTARAIMGWPWVVAVPFGALLVVSGPTVMTPLLRRIRPNRNLYTILEAEGVLIDPIGAILGVVVLEVVLAGAFGPAAVGLLGLPSRLALGTAAGAAGGFLLAWLLGHEDVIPAGLEGVFTLCFLLALVESVDNLLAGSGILAATVAGLVVGNLPGHASRELKAFKEQLAVMLVGLLFVLLAADVRMGQVTSLGARGLATVVILLFVVRPLDVAVSTWRSALTLRERAFLAWLSPRGIVAAGVASIFAQRMAQQGLPQGVELRALVFLVIAASVLVQGLSGGIVASLLKVRRPQNSGFVVAGANALGRALARALQRPGEDVVLIDTNATEAHAAEREGLRVLLGSALDVDVLERADAGARRGVLSTIPNEATGLLLAQRARHDFRVPRTWVAVRPGRRSIRTRRLSEARARLLFGRETDLDRWNQEVAHGGTTVLQLRYAGAADRRLREAEAELDTEDGQTLPLVVTRGDLTLPVDNETRVRPGDVVTFLVSGRPRSDGGTGGRPAEWVVSAPG